MKKKIIISILAAFLLVSCATKPAVIWVGDNYIFHTWSRTNEDGEVAWRVLYSDEPLAIFEYDGEILIFNNHAKTVYRTKSPHKFLLCVAELHREYQFDFIPIFELCGAFETPLIDKALSDERLAKQVSHTKNEKSRYSTFALCDADDEEVTFACGLKWSFCTCGSDGWNWLEIME
jgi:hypothetical protein